MKPLTEREQTLLDENLLLKKLLKKLPHIYTVEPGDTVYGIIKKYKGDADELDLLLMVKLNVKLVINPNLIHPGDELIIPREWVNDTPMTDQLSEQMNKEDK